MPVALDHAYSYRVPDELELAPGDIVAVPLGAREAIGVVWADERQRPIRGLHNRLKDVEDKLDVPPLKPELRKFVDWVSNYTLSPRGMVLRMCLRMGEHLGPGAREASACASPVPPPERMTRRARAGAATAWPTAWCARKSRGGARGRRVGRRHRRAGRRRHAGGAGAAAGAGGACARSGLSSRRNSRRRSAPRRDALRATVANGGFSVTLLDGVTGSGKTEVYFEAVAEAIRRKRQVLILMPEIALTAQFLDRFAERFGVRPAEWHSEIVAAQARAHLARGGGRRGLGRGRRALGAVPALRRSRPDRRR